MGETAIAKVEVEQMAITPELIKRYICPNATDQELFMAASIAKSYGLNPFKREVHIIKYGNAPASVVVGYEVYLKRAERTGKLNGWKVVVSEDKQTADITIHRKDWDKPFEWTVYRSEFDKGQANWKSMPAFMLKKVAMAQGFRLCFPDEMGGLPYLPEEIDVGSSETLPTGALQEHKEAPKPAPDKAPPSDTPGTDAFAKDLAQNNEIKMRDELEANCQIIGAAKNMEVSAVLASLTAYGKFIGYTKISEVPFTKTKRDGSCWLYLETILSKSKEAMNELDG